MTVRLIQDLPDAVIGFEASGKVKDDDYEDVIIPALKACLERHEKCRLLYVLGPESQGFDAGAMWDDAKLGLSHLGSWKRIAFVSDDGAYGTMVKAFGFAMPGEVKVFPLGKLADAKAWVEG